MQDTKMGYLSTIPEGYRVECSSISLDDVKGVGTITLYLEKLPPRRRVFECISETPRIVQPGEWFQTHSGNLHEVRESPTKGKYKVYREVTDQEGGQDE